MSYTVASVSKAQVSSKLSTKKKRKKGREYKYKTKEGETNLQPTS